MSKIFKNMIPYWKSIVIIIALLFVQAWCDLSLPSYTSDIIDVGIQNYGVEHVVPEALTADEFETAELFMTDEEADLWESIYEKDGDIYRLQVTSRSELNEIDDTLAVPLIMNYQMSAMEDSAVKEHVAKPTGADAGTLEKDTLLSMRDSMEETIDTMGSSLVKSMGAAYAVSCDKAAGIDVEKIQKSYLVTAGLKMVGMALMIGIVTVLVGFFASRVGAGIGRTLREKVFKQVVGFSNAEMDKFSTASLITRSTNDIQQNYHYEDLIRLCDMYAKMDLVNPAAIIDANHSNSGKQFKEQIRIVKEVMHNRQLSQDIHNMVKGVMIESYIEEGSQKIHDHIYGKSITDPCLGWEDSKKLIYDIAEMCK